MKNIMTLQAIVNDIGRKLGRIDTADKFRAACAMADDIAKDEALMAEILHEALTYRYTKDQSRSIRQFLRQAGAQV